MSEFGGGVEEIQGWPLVIKGKSLRISSIAKEIRLGEFSHVKFMYSHEMLIDV